MGTIRTLQGAGPSEGNMQFGKDNQRNFDREKITVS